jgi:hypothetical protein
MVTTTEWMVYGLLIVNKILNLLFYLKIKEKINSKTYVHAHASHSWPAMTFGFVLPVSTTSL